MPEVHGSRKGLDPHKKPENQPQPIVSSEIDRKPRLAQGRAGVRRKMKAPPSSYTRPGTSESRPIVVKDEADLILFHREDPLQKSLINYQKDRK